MLCSWVVKVCAKIANIAELRVVEEEHSPTTDTLQGGEIDLAQLKVAS